MKKIILVILCILLMGCQTNIEGCWVSPEGSTEITFEKDVVIFFGVEGTYEIRNSTIIMSFGTTTLEYGYELNGDTMILHLNDGDLILERKYK